MTAQRNKQLDGRTIVIGVTGSIAAYKAADLVSTLVQEQANVHVLMTPDATRFVTPLTFEALSGRRPITDMFRDGTEDNMAHIHIVEKADAYLIAPATANTIAKLATGSAGDIVSAVALVARCPLLIAPAMNHLMYAHPIVQENLKKLSTMGYGIVGPGEGFLACRAEGPGRLMDKASIMEALKHRLPG